MEHFGSVGLNNPKKQFRIDFIYISLNKFLLNLSIFGNKNLMIRLAIMLVKKVSLQAPFKKQKKIDMTYYWILMDGTG